MKPSFFFGIDTSNYTTSAAAVSAAGEVFFAKRPLPVPEKQVGLRQSDALFSHTKALPEVMAELAEKIRKKHPAYTVAAIGVSSRPRPVEGSYMPCFLAGVNAAGTAAAMQGVPLYEFSHQEGHLQAAKEGSRENGRPFPENASSFFGLHLSGGTLELVEANAKKEGGFSVSLVAAGLDITCGQLIDRCGVSLGLPFPAGAELEKLARLSEKRFSVKIPRKEKGINLSGFQNRFDEMMKNGSSPADGAAFVFRVVEEAVNALLAMIPEEKKNLPILFSGGVASSGLLQEKWAGENRYFAPPAYSADNAIGIAFLTKEQEEKNGRTTGDHRCPTE